MLLSDAAELLTRQDGLVSRRQLLDLGADPHDLVRWLRRRELVSVDSGVYVDHTGGLSAAQRSWAAVLGCGDRAALWGASALAAHEGVAQPGRGGPIQVAVPASRHPEPRPGVVVHRVRGLDQRVQWGMRPPRQRYDDAVIEVATGQATALDIVGVLSGAVGSRRTTAQRLLDACAARPRLRQRDWIVAVLRDVAGGACSVLEHGYLTKVERPHGLPTASRQVREGIPVVVYRDATYDEGLVVELDGLLAHGSSEQRDADHERDLDVALTGRTTVRLGWSQVFDRSCSTAGKIGRLLSDRGWPGRPSRCSPTCGAG